MEIVTWLIFGLVIGVATGALVTWVLSRARGGAVSAMQLKRENDKFKNEVTEHFVETARLINQMTDSYKQVFDHLSSGAEKLVDEKSLAERLPPASGEEVKLSHFGASATNGAHSNAAGRQEKAEDTAATKIDNQPEGDHRDLAGLAKPTGSDTPGTSESSDPLKSRANPDPENRPQESSDDRHAAGKSSDSGSGVSAGDSAGERKDKKGDDGPDSAAVKGASDDTRKDEKSRSGN